MSNNFRTLFELKPLLQYFFVPYGHAHPHHPSVGFQFSVGLLYHLPPLLPFPQISI